MEIKNIDSKIGIAFDLDGTLVDNNKYHIESWQIFYKKRGWQLSNETYNLYFNGKTNKDVLNFIYQTELSPAIIKELTDEKEKIYREIYLPFIKPVNGLIDFMESLKNHKIPMVMATSGIPENIKFFFDNVPVEHYFQDVINFTHITKGKPDPEIYLLAAQKLGLNPKNCTAFEDSLSGIQSAKDAGFKVIAITTTHTKQELTKADLVIDDFTELKVFSF